MSKYLGVDLNDQMLGEIVNILFLEIFRICSLFYNFHLISRYTGCFLNNAHYSVIPNKKLNRKVLYHFTIFAIFFLSYPLSKMSKIDI